MADDTNGIDKGWDTLSQYSEKSADADDAVTVSLSTTPGEWLVNTAESVVLPMSMAEVVGALRAGKLSERSLVWRSGMQEWAPLDKVPQLKLAARLPLSKPPPKPARATPMPTPTPMAPQVGLSRKSTLPFGIPAQKPASHPSNPAQRKLTPLPRPAAAPTPSEEPKVLAVYERPAPTISFELDRADSERAPIPAPPETLAPTTSDTQPRIRAAAFEPPSGAGTVAVGQFEALRRSAKRWVVASSLVSAAAASLLTFWLSHRAAPSAVMAPAAMQAPIAAAPPAAAPSPPAPAPPAETAPAPSVAAPPPSVEVAEKPAKKARAPRAVWRPRAPVAPAANRDAPSAEPNPYDVKLEEDAPSSSKKPAATADTAPKEIEASTGSESPSPGL
jgi:hypothetical protein